MKRSPTLLLVLLALLLVGAEARAQSAAVFLRRVEPARSYAARGATTAFVTVSRDAVREFRLSGGGLLDVPLADGSTLALRLETFDVLAPGATVTLTGAAGPVPYTPDLTLFKGQVVGDEGSLAVLAMTPEQVTGTIQQGGRRLLIQPLATAGADHAIADAASLPAAPPQPFECPSEDLPMVGLAPPANLPALPANVQATTTRLMCDMALDCDYDFFVKEGSDSTRAVNYALTMLGTTSAIYEREINVRLQATYLNLWTTSGDPYAATTLQTALTEFTDWWNAYRTGVSRDLAQLVSGRQLGGGIAFISQLCSQSYGYSVIGNLYGANTYPTNTSTWDIIVMAHELGHNFGSFHTHSCWWQANGYAPAGTLLDSCYAQERPNDPCYTGGVGMVPFLKGTIMSYCHLLGGGDSNIRLDFHTACKTVMRYYSEAASCFVAAVVQPPYGLTAANGPGGVSLGWTASGTPGVIGYDVYKSAFQQDLNPVKIGSTTGLAFGDLDLGTLWYKVRAVRGSDSSAFCGELKTAVCAPSLPVQYNTAAQPLGLLAADFNEDGILDLATANFSADNVSILIGQGSGGVGNGTFTAPVNYGVTSGAFPAALATGDFNADGITDLAVAAEEGGWIDILLGQGSGGVGNGAFAAGVTVTTSAGPWALATGDFNADGITDLAVACQGGQAGILLGQGSGGVGNGAFAAAVNYACGSGARGIATGDFNSDGITDLAVSGSTGVGVLLGQGGGGVGNGTFGARTTYTCGSAPNGVTTGDFNSDGITDLAVSNSSGGSVSVLRGNGSAGNGDGTFAAAATYACGANPYSISVGDWNGDGHADLVVPNGGGTPKTLTILPGRANGTFGTGQSYTTVAQARWIVPGDFNSDGMADFAVANGTNPGKVAILLASCLSPLPAALAVTNPSGRPQWITGQQHATTWSRGAGVMAVNVDLSRDGGANWVNLATGLTDTAFTWNVAGPYTTQARVRVVDPSVPTRVALNDSSFTIIPASMLDVDGRLPTGIALRGVWPNPARDAARVWFTLASDAPARLELLDLSGRRVRALEVGPLGAGLHSADLDRTSSLPPGLYFVRLAQAGRAATAKLVLTR